MEPSVQPLWLTGISPFLASFVIPELRLLGVPPAHLCREGETAPPAAGEPRVHLLAGHGPQGLRGRLVRVWRRGSAGSAEAPRPSEPAAGDVAIGLYGVYGPEDDFAATSPHPLVQMLRALHEGHCRQAPVVRLAGEPDGTLELLYVEDAARAIAWAALRAANGSRFGVHGTCATHGRVAQHLAGLTGFAGRIAWTGTGAAPAEPAGPTGEEPLPGFAPLVPLAEGLRRTLDWWRATGSRGQGPVPARGQAQPTCSPKCRW